MSGTVNPAELLAAVVKAATAAGDRLLAEFSPDARPASRADMAAAGVHTEELVLAELRPQLASLRPQAGWVDEDLETTPLPAGEWWVVDAVEGAVNYVHGMPEWCVTVTLMSDGQPVLAVARQPVGDLTYTAVRDAGAHLNGRPLHTSAKSSLDAAIAVTGQAEAGQDDTYRRIGESVTAMLGQALLVRAFVPSTFPMLLVAAGQTVRPGPPAAPTSSPPLPACTGLPPTLWPRSPDPARPRIPAGDHRAAHHPGRLRRHRAGTDPPGPRTRPHRHRDCPYPRPHHRPRLGPADPCRGRRA